MAALASDWLRHSRLLLWNHWTEFNETWKEARSQRPLPILCFWADLKKQDGRPGLWLAETFSTSPLKPLNGIQRNLTGSKISMPSTNFCVFGPIGNTRLPLASDWLRHFLLQLWNRWKEFNETWQEARSERPLPSFYFSGQSEKQDGRPGLWLAETFSTSPLKTLNRIQQNLTGSMISKSSTKFVFFGPIGKTRWPPWPNLQKGGTSTSRAYAIPFRPSSGRPSVRLQFNKTVNYFSAHQLHVLDGNILVPWDPKGSKMQYLTLLFLLSKVSYAPCRVCDVLVIVQVWRLRVYI